MPDRPYTIPPAGSLGLLALGWRGIEAWREVRGTTWMDALDTPRPAPTAEGSDALAEAEITVVSGLPRSGTSMVMQMVAAGGVPVYSDQAREADESNPRGYYEHERVKRLMHDATWVPDADGHVVKVVAPLLPFLPPGPHYRVVFVERALDEVLRSQTAMLDRTGAMAAPNPVLEAAYRRYLDGAHAWADAHADALRLDHAAILAHPAIAAERLRTFLDLDAEVATLAIIVDPTLHRQTS